MYESLETCPSCNHHAFENKIICEDHANTHESFAIVQCHKCGLSYTNPRPQPQHINKYYQHTDYISHTNSANTPINLAYKLARTITLRQKLKIVKTHNQSNNLLDYGCGTGVFLKYMKDHSYITSGFEPDPNASAIATRNSGHPMINKLSQIPLKRFDIVTAWHVLEHVHDLKETLRTLRKSLTSGGKLFIALPNINSFDCQKYSSHWAAYDVPRHLYHFNQSSFASLAKTCKLQITHTYPMKLDAYYVSLLSEKYLRQTNSIAQTLKALRVGYHSNQMAQQTSEYSSLIYVLQP